MWALAPPVLLATLLGACAGAQPPPPAPPPPGSELATDEKLLDEAFNAPSEQPRGKVPEVVPPWSAPPSEPSAAERELADRLAAARRALEAGDLDGAASASSNLSPGRLKTAPPAMKQEAFALIHRIAVAREDWAAARRASERWLLSCGPQHLKACWRRALAALAASGPPQARPALQRNAEALSKAAACIERAEAVAKRRTGELPDCMGKALSAARKMGDRLTVSRALLAQASVALRKERNPRKAVAKLSPVAKTCPEPRCAEVRRNVYQRLTAAHLELKDPDAAVRAALREVEAHSWTLSPGERPYARTAGLDRACKALEEQRSPGACRKLERAVLGRHVFHDFSREVSAEEGLSRDAVRQVNEHYGISLDPCFTAQALRLPPNQVETYQVRWTVLNDGRVDAAALDRKYQDAGPLGDCLREQFHIWRYPRYRGERQNVEQSFRVQAQTR